MRVACLFVCVLGLLAVGCGGDGVDISTSEDNVCSELAEVACNNMYQCCTEGEIEDILEVSEPRTELQCREDIKRECQRLTLSLKDSLAAGRVTFNAERMNACLKSIVAPEDSCGTIASALPWREACMESAWVGTVPVDGTCIFGHDCAGAPDNFCASNKCVAKPTAGFPCVTNSSCASAFYCAAGTCQPRLAVGAPCQSTSQCQTGNFCDTAALPMPVCAARAQGGAPCTLSDGCLSGQCAPGRCMGSTASCFRDSDCARCPNTGIPCTSSAQCAPGTCSVGGNSCTSQTSCVAGGGDTCVFPVTCPAGDCVGDPVCITQTVSVDYCSSIEELPIPVF